MTEGWTLDQLVARVADALAADGVRAPNGRVREVPDARALRWYATIGLLDRPSAFRGRTALYGPRHLLQAVAVKRRQAEGMALAQIQAELSGATDAMLHRVAQLPAPLLADAPAPADARPSSAELAELAELAEVRSPRAPFWRAMPASMSGVRSGEPDRAEPDRTEPVHTKPVEAEVSGVGPVRAGAEARHLIRLGPGATLVLTAAPSAADVADLRAAAAPLIRLLADRALLTAEEPRHDDH
jgi:DNA-binding transcriptional MerR regulator